MKYLIPALLLAGFFFNACQPAEKEPAVEGETVMVEKDTLDTLKIKAPAPQFKTKEDFTELFPENYILDLKYATAENFIDTAIYPCARCFLHPPAALALEKARKEFDEQGYRIKLFDCYRPLAVQEKMWEIMPDERYVAHPDSVSWHNKGLAVDLTLVDNNGKQLDMGTPFDDFGPEAHRDFKGHSKKVRQNRELLTSVMERHGFKPIKTEWWHFSYPIDGVGPETEVWECR